MTALIDELIIEEIECLAEYWVEVGRRANDLHRAAFLWEQYVEENE